MTVSGRRFSNVIGFDDAPFSHDCAGDVPVVGVIFARLRMNGVLIGAVEKDGDDAAKRLADLLATSKFIQNVQLVMLQGITLAGFNVVDILDLHARLGLPIIAVTRHRPDLQAIRDALIHRVRGGMRKWAILERLGPVETAGRVYIQRVGLTHDEAVATLHRFTVEGNIPEPLRVAHLIAGALVKHQSRGRA